MIFDCKKVPLLTFYYAGGILTSGEGLVRHGARLSLKNRTERYIDRLG